ncbi:MAG TPA: hypothetical protein VH157_07105 [Bryobacteraceae bacterium]|jgi:hypothetical protein|nr:hypothetical protein [Bryobacteraceae bacterium]
MSTKRRFQTGGNGPSDAAIGKAALLSDPQAQAALAEAPAPKPVHPQVARALAVATLRRQRRQAMTPGFQYGGMNALPPMPAMPDLSRELANLRQAGLLTGSQQMSPMDVLKEMNALQQAPDFQTPPFLGGAKTKVIYPGTQPSPPPATEPNPDPGTSDPSNDNDDDADDNAPSGRSGGRFRDAGEYSPPKKARGGILRRRPKAILAVGPAHPAAAGPKEDGPKHLPIPVFSTTIIIAHKKPTKRASSKKPEAKKPEAKAKGGPIGRMKTRGSGIAKRGTRFSGIF